METHGGWRIYFAGPDVFEVDARERFDRLQALATANGLQALVPVDEAGADEGAARAARICRGNLALLRQADAVVSDMIQGVIVANRLSGSEADDAARKLAACLTR